MPTIEAIASRAEAVDGVPALDEATWRAVRSGEATVVRTQGAFALVRGAELSLIVDPPVRGRGLGGALADQVLAAHPQLTQAWSHGNHPAAARLAARHGWTRVRDLWVMRRALTDSQSDPALRNDVLLRRWSGSATDREELLRVNAAAFATHPEQGAMDAADLAARMAEPWFDPAGLILATDGVPDGRLLGFHWTKQHSPTVGEVYVVGVDPAAQGRGLGRLLTGAGLRHLAAQGVSEVLLYVESDNAAAINTYSGLGFTHAAEDTHVMYAAR